MRPYCLRLSQYCEQLADQLPHKDVPYILGSGAGKSHRPLFQNIGFYPVSTQLIGRSALVEFKGHHHTRPHSALHYS